MKDTNDREGNSELARDFAGAGLFFPFPVKYVMPRTWRQDTRVISYMNNHTIT